LNYLCEVYHKVKTVKIVTWNVNGLRAVLGKGALDQVWELAPDVLCLQEVKSRAEQLTEAQANSLRMKHVWNPAERAGYSGVATFYAKQPLQIEMGLGVPEFDTEGRVISTLHSGFRLYNVYFPNGQRGKDRVDYKLEFYATLLKLCDKLHESGENIIITGDFNTAHMPIDLRNPKSNEKTSGFLPEEREWVQKYLDHGFVDIYRKLYPDRAQYTWWTYISNARARNVGWRIDYFLISEGLVSRVKDVVIHDGIPGSDHCPVELILK
jgi:exodeoxyribonuclease-3